MFGHLGIEASHKPVNDILVGGKKISGSAQCRNRDSIMQHGSIILSMDCDAVDRHLLSGKGSEWMVSVEDMIGYVPERSIIIEALRTGFRDVFGEMADDELTYDEKETIRKLMEQEVWK